MTRSRRLHSWNVVPTAAVTIQRELAGRVICTGRLADPRLVAGADLAFSQDGQRSVAGVVVWDVRRACVVEERLAWEDVRFPYVPGMLSFREAPSLIAAIGKLRSKPDAFIFDGQGLAHPRRFGLACHVGLWIDRPSLGCAKSLLVGEYAEPASDRGSMSRLMHGEECVGMVVRTRDRVKPVYVSVGHRLSLETAVDIVLRSCEGFRVPEPTRLADKLVAGARTEG
jgi:deoxyribonuclease V